MEKDESQYARNILDLSRQAMTPMRIYFKEAKRSSRGGQNVKQVKGNGWALKVHDAGSTLGL